MGWGFNVSGAMKQKKKEILEEIADLETLEESGTLSLEQCMTKISLNT
jgi:hypothetical protein